MSDTVFHYSPYGLLFSSTAHTDDILKAASTLTEQKAELINPQTVTEYSPGIFYFRPTVKENEDPTPPISGGRVSNPSIFRTCDEVSKSFWEKIFGQSENCDDHFESGRRLRTKVWNTNYFIYSSIGISVKRQKRTLGIWWASSIDEIELGYEYASFKYPKFGGQFPNFRFKYYYEYNGWITDQNGLLIREFSPVDLFKQFPISDPDQTVVKIFAGDDKFSNIFNQTGSEINAYTKKIAKAAYQALTKYGQQLNNQGTVIVNYDNINNFEAEVSFTHTNWFKTNYNDNSISRTFDWNTGQLSFKYSGGGVNPTPVFSAKSYSKAKILSYGAGRRGSTWRGSNIFFQDN